MYLICIEAHRRRIVAPPAPTVVATQLKNRPKINSVNPFRHDRYGAGRQVSVPATCYVK